jgi:GAF domain-containing protein
MNQEHATDAARLLCLARDVPAATGAWNTDTRLEPLTAFLREVRRALGMQVAFVARFARGHRVVAAVDLDAPARVPLLAGDIDELEDTYCHLVAREQLHAVVRDTAAHPGISALPITRRLGIGCYISARVVLRSGEVYGTLCCFSQEARPDLQEIDAAALQAVADAIAADIDRHGQLTSRIWQWSSSAPA